MRRDSARWGLLDYRLCQSQAAHNGTAPEDGCLVSPTAQALGSLRNLEELRLPSGDGIHQVAKLIVQQCLQLCCLRVLIFHHILDDASVIEIGEFPSEKGPPLCGSSGVPGAACCKYLEPGKALVISSGVCFHKYLVFQPGWQAAEVSRNLRA